MSIAGTLVTLPECWGFDTNTKLNAKTAQNLTRAPLPNGNVSKFCWRYVSLSNPLPGDLDIEERDAILNAGLTLLLVQHVNYPGWFAAATLGSSHGQAAAAHAKLVEYPQGAHLACDLEGVNDESTPAQVIDYVNGWCRAVIAAGYLPCLYVGYACGLTPQQLWELPLVSRYWSDFGKRNVANRGFTCVQSPQVTVAGVQVDPDHAMPDKLGGCLVGMGKL